MTNASWRTYAHPRYALIRFLERRDVNVEMPIGSVPTETICVGELMVSRNAASEQNN